MSRIVRKESPNIQSWIRGQNNPEKQNFINLDRYLFVELLSSHELEQLYIGLDRC